MARTSSLVMEDGVVSSLVITVILFVVECLYLQTLRSSELRVYGLRDSSTQQLVCDVLGITCVPFFRLVTVFFSCAMVVTAVALVRAIVPVLVTVNGKTQDAIWYLAQTALKYCETKETLKRRLYSLSLMKTISEECNTCYSLCGTTEETQHSEILGPVSEQENYRIKPNVPKDTGYLENVGTSSSESSLSLCSDSEPEDDISTSLSKANEENGHALLGGHQFLESILKESCDPKEVVNRLSENVEQLSLTEPDPNTKKLVRCLAMKAKCLNRLDVVKQLRDMTPAGTTGPLLPENLQVQGIPFQQRRRLTISLSGGDEWKLVAERLGLTPEEIRFLDKRTQNPAEAMLGHVAQLRSITVGDLYDLLVDCELPVMADIL